MNLKIKPLRAFEKFSSYVLRGALEHMKKQGL